MNSVPIQPSQANALLAGIRKKHQYLLCCLLLCFLGLIAGVLFNLSGQVNPGFRAIHSSDNNWRITQSDYESLAVGTEISHLSIDGNVFAIESQWLAPSMVTIKNETELHQFVAGERLLYDAIQAQSVQLIDVAGKRYDILFQPRSIWDTSLYFWLHPFLALLSVLMALWACWVGRYNHYHVINILASVAFMVSLVIAVSALDRIWAVNPNRLIERFYLGNLSMRFFTVGYLYLIWHIPYRIGKRTPFQHAPLYLLAVYLVTWLLQVTGWHEFFELFIIKIIFIGGVLATAGIFIQWYLSNLSAQSELVNQMALRWMAATVAIACVFGFGYNMLWQQGYADGLESDLINSFIALMVKMGITALLLKHLLYKFETWWWRVWGIFGGLTLGLLALLISAELVFGYSHAALMVALATFVAGYFFIGAYFRYRYAKHDAKIMERSVPQLVKVATSFDEPTQARQYWRDVLEQTFHPLNVQTQMTSQEATQKTPAQAVLSSASEPSFPPISLANTMLTQKPARIFRNGEALLVKGLYDEVVMLSGAASGMRLFTARDAERAALFWHIASQGQLTQQAFLEGESSERKRIAADLHDDIGGKLLYLSSAQGKFGSYARETLEDLRTLTHGLSTSEKTFAELVADLNYGFAERCDITQVTYDAVFELAERADDVVSSRGATMLSSVMAELLRNALQHDGVSWVSVSIHVKLRQLTITLENDGATTDPNKWASGLGTLSIRRRVNDVDGDVSWEAREGGGVICTASWDVLTWLSLK